MKRSLVAAIAVALLLTGCATGDTGHLDPDIDPELVGPRSTPEPDAGGSGASDDATDAGEPAASAADVEEAFADAAGSQPWYGDVTAVELAGDSVLVTTRLTQEGDDAVAVCEAAAGAAESTGVAEPSVEVRGAEGEMLAERGAGGGTCSG